MGIGQLSGIRDMTQLAEMYARNDRQISPSTASAGTAPSSWGPDTVSISAHAREELNALNRNQNPELPEQIKCTIYAREELDALLQNPEPDLSGLPEQAKCTLKVNGKTIDIAECLREYIVSNDDGYTIMNEFTHNGPNGLLKALSTVTGIPEGDIKNALQGMSISEAADFAIGLGDMLGFPPSIFEESLGTLTGLTAALIERQLQEILGTDYRKAVAIDA